MARSDNRRWSIRVKSPCEASNEAVELCQRAKTGRERGEDTERNESELRPAFFFFAQSIVNVGAYDNHHA